MGDEQDAEDAPEIVSFYREVFEGDAFFWLLDRSSSMAGDGLVRLKAEVVSAIRQLSRSAEFAIVAFDSSFSVFPASNKAVQAREAKKDHAARWVNNIEVGDGSSMLEPAIRILEIANATPHVRRRVMFVVGDGHPGHPDDVLEVIKKHNKRDIQINTILVSTSTSGRGEVFFKKIASQNKGKFIVRD